MSEKTNDILLELKKNFMSDKMELKNRIIECETEITECNDFIESLNKKEDCDFNLFSPRSASRVYKEQIDQKKKRITELENEIKEDYKKLSNVTKKIDSLNEINSDDIVKNSSISEEDADKYGDITDNTIFLKLQEDDRQRIANELHDGVLQSLTLLIHKLELAEKFIDYDPVRAKLELETDRNVIKDCIDDIRNTIFDLRPMQFDDLGFKKTVEHLVESYQKKTSIEIEKDIDDLSDINEIYLISAYRISQELLVNAIKHSEAKNISMIVKQGNKNIYIEVSDNGEGFRKEVKPENHFGLKILKERVKVLKGNISIDTGKTGTKVTINVPIAERE